MKLYGFSWNDDTNNLKLNTAVTHAQIYPSLTLVSSTTDMRSITSATIWQCILYGWWLNSLIQAQVFYSTDRQYKQTKYKIVQTHQRLSRKFLISILTSPGSEDQCLLNNEVYDITCQTVPLYIHTETVHNICTIFKF